MDRSCGPVLSTQSSVVDRRYRPPLGALSSHRPVPSGQHHRRRGCSSGRFSVSLHTPRSVRRTSKDVHVAQGHRDHSATAHLLGVPDGSVKTQLARERVRPKEIVRKSPEETVMPSEVHWFTVIHKKRPKRSYGAPN